MNVNTQREYDRDFYTWALHSAQLLRQGKFSEVDIENVAEEIESMGKRDRRQIISRLAVLIAHLLKWKFQKDKRSNSWESTIKEQRIKVIDLLDESPSLKHELEEKLYHAYEQSTLIATRETGLSPDTFPNKCPFNIEQCLDKKFFPD